MLVRPKAARQRLIIRIESVQSHETAVPLQISRTYRMETWNDLALGSQSENASGPDLRGDATQEKALGWPGVQTAKPDSNSIDGGLIRRLLSACLKEWQCACPSPIEQLVVGCCEEVADKGVQIGLSYADDA